MVWTRFGTTQDPNAMLTVTQVEYLIPLYFISISLLGFLFCVDYSSTNSSIASSYHASTFYASTINASSVNASSISSHNTSFYYPSNNNIATDNNKLR
jgi:hypothetical protein